MYLQCEKRKSTVQENIYKTQTNLSIVVVVSLIYCVIGSYVVVHRLVHRFHSFFGGYRVIFFVFEELHSFLFFFLIINKFNKVNSGDCDMKLSS